MLPLFGSPACGSICVSMFFSWYEQVFVRLGGPSLASNRGLQLWEECIPNVTAANASSVGTIPLLDQVRGEWGSALSAIHILLQEEPLPSSSRLNK